MNFEQAGKLADALEQLREEKELRLNVGLRGGTGLVNVAAKLQTFTLTGTVLESVFLPFLASYRDSVNHKLDLAIETEYDTDSIYLVFFEPDDDGRYPAEMPF